MKGKLASGLSQGKPCYLSPLGAKGSFSAGSGYYAVPGSEPATENGFDGYRADHLECIKYNICQMSLDRKLRFSKELGYEWISIHSF